MTSTFGKSPEFRAGENVMVALTSTFGKSRDQMSMSELARHSPQLDIRELYRIGNLINVYILVNMSRNAKVSDI
ncbi:hypothetical protein DPMN_041122 [Dreissena polymorpha]|uniref:Uncharacterized protein n=1 Tax=Dreissena polymorpha TaxID=45954 RepID=A0A9D4HXK8_DREPO|nr:hypothetical protein DPMN_041122 [Dreissena polymorpha]